jgi:Ca2+-binding EF-hand superfamily protein
MISRRDALFLTVAGLVAAATPALAQSRKSTFVGQFDADNDGTVDLAEAKKAAGDLFDKLDTDNDGTLNLKELRGRVSHKDLTAADPDHDNTLTKDEYLAVVEKRFKAADKDNDGTLSSWELHTPAGKALVRLLR